MFNMRKELKFWIGKTENLTYGNIFSKELT